VNLNKINKNNQALTDIMSNKNKNNKNKKKSKGNNRKPKSQSLSLTNNKDVRRPARIRSKPSSTRNVSGKALVRRTCAIVNPFCPAAKGSRWPDGLAMNTIAEQLRGNFTIPSDSAGYATTCFCAGLPYGYLQTYSRVGQAVTFNSAFTSYGTSLAATYAQAYRIISFGCVVRNVASATNSSGLVTLGTVGVCPGPSSTITVGLEKYLEQAVVALQPGMEYSWISKPIGANAFSFTNPVSTAAGGQMALWTSLIVEVTGGPTSQPTVNVEWFVNVEFTLPQGSAMADLAPPGASEEPFLIRSANRVIRNVGSLLEGGVDYVERSISRAATSYITDTLRGNLVSSMEALVVD
jgi:hypothetical protein